MANNLDLEEFIDEDFDIKKSFRKDAYTGDVILAFGAGIGITGLLTDYSLVLAGGFSFLAGLGYRVCVGYTHNRVIARENSKPPTLSTSQTR